MNDPEPSRSVQNRMRQIRLDLDQDVRTVVVNARTMVANARTMVDWRHYVKTSPWLCLGAAAAAGFLLVPKRISERAEGQTLESSPRLGRAEAAIEPARVGKGIAETLVAALAGVAIRTATQYVSQQAARFLAPREH
jgi:hypothetical protein